ncbi:MAG: YkgJ family cysteine cluster protein [Candidatus Thorarchaeota archaeon]
MNPLDVRFKCTMCGACCKHTSLVVTLTGRDIVRIARAIEFDSSQILKIIDFYLPKKRDALPQGLKHIPRVLTEKGPAIIALKKRESGACVFLTADNLCAIHQFRPGACASFPFVFKESNGDIMWGFSAMKEICPGIGDGPKISEPELHDIARDVLEDLQIYGDFTSDWNSLDSEHDVNMLLESILSDIRFNV